jgi:Protein of unknown function (DUF1580)
MQPEGFFVNDTNQVLTEIQSGDSLSLSKAAKLVPGSSGGHANPCTIFRWAETGCRAADGQRVRLEHVRSGGRIFTSAAAVQRFLMRLTHGTAAPASVRTPKQRQQAAEKAGKELAAAGW